MRTDSASKRQSIRSGANAARSRRSAIVVLIGGLLFSAPTYAYIDPGTGSIILQGLLAGIAVGYGIARSYWERIKNFLARRRTTSKIESPAGVNSVREEAEVQSKT